MTIATNRIALSLPNNSYAQRRTDLMHFTAAIPLLAIKTFSMTLFPPNLLTNSAGVATYNKKYNGSSQKTTELEFEYYLYYHNTSLYQIIAKGGRRKYKQFDFNRGLFGVKIN